MAHFVESFMRLFPSLQNWLDVTFAFQMWTHLLWKGRLWFLCVLWDFGRASTERCLEEWQGLVTQGTPLAIWPRSSVSSWQLWSIFFVYIHIYLKSLLTSDSFLFFQSKFGGNWWPGRCRRCRANDVVDGRWNERKRRKASRKGADYATTTQS